MPHELYCIYNQTSESFLSLGASLGDRPFLRFKQWLGIGPRRIDEGCWIKPFTRRALTLLPARDLIYLDAAHRVVEVTESLPSFRRIPFSAEAASVLALPPRTIASSHTEPGNQLLICAPKEMEWRLRTLPGADHAPAAIIVPVDPVAAFLAPPTAAKAIDCAYRISADGGEHRVHAIRDLSPRGLYLVTRDRWPIGAEVKMSLQPIAHAQNQTLGPITVRMKVIRWGGDGVGLEFTGHQAEASELAAQFVN